jgi:hypothetical protein
MSIRGFISSEPVYAESRIKFKLLSEDTHREVVCLTELDFGQFGPINQGDHVVLTGATVQENLEGHENYFCADSINAVPKGGVRRSLSHF